MRDKCLHSYMEVDFNNCFLNIMTNIINADDNDAHKYNTGKSL